MVFCLESEAEYIWMTEVGEIWVPLHMVAGMTAGAWGSGGVGMGKGAWPPQHSPPHSDVDEDMTDDTYAGLMAADHFLLLSKPPPPLNL